MAVRYYGMFFVGVFLGGFYLLRWQMTRVGWDEDDVSDFIIPAMMAVVLGSRFGHVVFYDWAYYSSHPAEIIKFWKGGLASHGATLGILFGMWWFSLKKRMSFAEMGDRFSFSIALGASLVRFGNFFNSEIVGRVTDQSWGVRFPLSAEDRHLALLGKEIPLRHPSQLYEGIMGAAILLILVIVDRIYKEKRPRGLLLGLVVSLYFTGRFTVEFFKEFQTGLRSDQFLTMGQYLSIPLALAGYAVIFYSFKNRKPAHTDPSEITPIFADKTPNKAAPSKKKQSKKSKRKKGKHK
jgi:phosphatidylglycerol---prolipoprotein diacylglyceryl transferase